MQPPHLPFAPELPGILGPLAFRPEMAGPLLAFTNQLLRGPSPLTPGERELIATFASHTNQCRFCTKSHAAVAAVHLSSPQLVAAVLEDVESAPVTPKMRALLKIARAVALNVAPVSDELMQAARDAGADDTSLHDAVLVAASFCMFNRYVESLRTVAPDDPSAYVAMGERLARDGYAMVP